MPTLISSQFKGPSNTNDGTMIAVMYDGSDVHPSLTCNNAGGEQRMPDKENFNGIIEMEEIQQVSGPLEAKDGRGVHSQFASEGKLIPVREEEMETETYVKVSHAKGKDGEGERWEKSDECGTRTVFDNSDVRTQEAITECEIQNFKADLAGGDTDTAAVTGDHDSRSTDFTNLITSKENNNKPKEDPIAVLDMQGGKIGANYQMGCDTTPAITRGRGSADDVHSVAYHYAVRRITCIEGCRLQGFADGWTRPCFTPDQITDELVDRFIGIHQNWLVINANPRSNKKTKPKSRKWVRNWLLKISSADCPDGPRYKAIGNSMSVNVMQWIGMRIAEADRGNSEVAVKEAAAQ